MATCLGGRVELKNSGDAVRPGAPTLPEPPIACTSIFVRGHTKVVEHDASEPGTSSTQRIAYRVSLIHSTSHSQIAVEITLDKWLDH